MKDDAEVHGQGSEEIEAVIPIGWVALAHRLPMTDLKQKAKKVRSGES